MSERFSELDASLVLYRDRGPKAALELMRTDFGRRSMDRIRSEVDAIQRALRTDLIEHHRSWNQDVAFSRVGLAIIAGLNVALLLLAYVQARRDILQRDTPAPQPGGAAAPLEDESEGQAGEELSELSGNLQEVQEAEKAKLARDIHDELGSILVSARMDVSWARQQVEPLDPASAQKLARASGTLDEGVQIKRHIIEDLRPTLLDNLGLAAAFDWHLNEACERGGSPTCRCRGGPRASQSGGHRSVSRRPGGVTNVLRYAKARNAEVLPSAHGHRHRPGSARRRCGHSTGGRWVTGFRIDSGDAPRVGWLRRKLPRSGQVAGGGTAIEVSSTGCRQWRRAYGKGCESPRHGAWELCQ